MMRSTASKLTPYRLLALDGPLSGAAFIGTQRLGIRKIGSGGRGIDVDGTVGLLICAGEWTMATRSGKGPGRFYKKSVGRNVRRGGGLSRMSTGWWRQG